MAANDNSTPLGQLYTFDPALGTFSSGYTTESGVFIEDTEVMKGLVESLFKDKFGLEVPDPATPLGRLVEWLAINFATAMRVNVQNANQLVISAAAGQQLDAIALWFGLYRKIAVASTVEAILSGAENTVIPAGARARTVDGAVFSLTESVTLTEPYELNGTTVYQAKGIFRATETGPVECPAGTLNAIDSPTLGWTMVYNPEDGVIGRNTETDDSLRARIEASRFHGTGFIYSMKNAIEAIDGVNTSMVVENYTNEEKTIHGIDRMTPHSIFVCVDCPQDDYAAVAKAVFDQKPCGTAYHVPGGFEEDGITPKRLDDCHLEMVEDAFGNEYPVYIHSPINTGINVNIIVRNRTFTGTDLKETVASAVKDWFSTRTYGIGETVYAADVIRSVEADVPGVIVLGCGVSDGGTKTDVGSEVGEDSDAYVAGVHNLAYQEIAASRRAVFGKVLVTVR